MNRAIIMLDLAGVRYPALHCENWEAAQRKANELLEDELELKELARDVKDTWEPRSAFVHGVIIVYFGEDGEVEEIEELGGCE